MTSTEDKICKQCASYEDKILSIQLIIHNIKFDKKDIYKDVISSPTPPVYSQTEVLMRHISVFNKG